MLEKNKIYNMDCLEGLKLIDDESIDLIVTDPPYYIQKLKENLKSQTIRKGFKNPIFHADWDSIWKDKESFLNWIYDLFLEFRRVLNSKGQIYMFMSYHHTPDIILWLRNNEDKFKFYKTLIWYKPDTMGVFPNQYGCNYESILWLRKEDKGKGKVKLNIGCGQRDVFKFNSTNNKYREECGFHPTPKPINLISRLIKNGSNENDLILDAFMGSGTTAVACKNNKRNYIGFELDKNYCDIATKRLNQTNVSEWFG
jgi:site-specific DNA-methyltransferase (adenine-specific)